MPNIVRVLGFSLTIVLFFTLVANILPQVEGEAPVDKKVDLSALTMDTFIDMGEDIFKGKGTCTLCHNNMGRAPDILAFDAVATANDRLSNSKYKGNAVDPQSYFLESMKDTSMFVVEGFGQKGSNDTISPMPAANKPPIGLSNIEMDAVIAFLQSKDGNDVTVTLPTGDTSQLQQKTEEPALPVLAKTAEEAVTKFACTACHSVAGSKSLIGPDLSDIGTRLSKSEILESIVYPSAVIAKGFPPIMPANVADKISPIELRMLVDYLSNQKGE
jgi:mono/diheme cytochrome c family protein